LKHLLLFSSVVIVIGALAASGQEKTTAPANETVSFSPSDVKVLGTISSGQTSKLVEYSNAQEYRALVFEGHGNDRIEVTVIGANGGALLALADSTLTPIASGNGRLSATLPYHGDDVEAFYILIKGGARQGVAVHLKSTAAALPPQATR
jgi:hypothetical protein